MGTEVVNDILSQLKRDEGCRLKSYQDQFGNWTIGTGHELYGVPPAIASKMCWTQEQCDDQLRKDVQHAAYLVQSLPCYSKLDPVRQAVLINMAFNLGTKLLKFHGFLACLQHQDYDGASIEMLRSLWAQEVPERAHRLSVQMKTGQWQ